jgi:NAD(P)-dependent dehydrogenase (short-subunit alcohol dehydrogenase family)
LITVYSNYRTSKAAVISLTQSAGQALIKHGINANGISPGVVDTPMWDEVDALFAKYENRPIGEKKRLVGEGVPFGRMASLRILLVVRFFWQAARVITLWRRHTMSMAVSG